MCPCQPQRALDRHSLLDEEAGAQLGVGQVEGAPSTDRELASPVDPDGAEGAHGKVHAAADPALALDAEVPADEEAGGADRGPAAALVGVPGAPDRPGGFEGGIADQELAGDPGVAQVDAAADQRAAARLVVDEEDAAADLRVAQVQCQPAVGTGQPGAGQIQRARHLNSQQP